MRTREENVMNSGQVTGRQIDHEYDLGDGWRISFDMDVNKWGEISLYIRSREPGGAMETVTLEGEDFIASFIDEMQTAFDELKSLAPSMPEYQEA